MRRRKQAKRKFPKLKKKQTVQAINAMEYLRRYYAKGEGMKTIMVLVGAVIVFLWTSCAVKPQLLTEVVTNREEAYASSMAMSKKFRDLGCKRIHIGLVRENEDARLLGICTEYGKGE